ncbi:MAG: hypothetical protein AAF957_22935 [Planctomycetota bacterium]
MTQFFQGHRRPVVLVLGLTALLAGCPDDDTPVSQQRVPTVAVYAPSAGAFPLPNDLAYSGTLDGTLRPEGDDPMPAEPTASVSTLDGWSTSAPIVAQFSRPIAASSVIGGDTVRVFRVLVPQLPGLPVGGPVVDIQTELVAGTDYDVEVASEYGGAAIRVLPLAPLVPSTLSENSVYMVVCTNQLRDTDGFQIVQDAEYRFASVRNPLTPPTPPSLIQLQVLVDAQLRALESSTALDRSDVAVSFTFTTQSVNSGLNTVVGIASGLESLIISNLCGVLTTCGTDTMDNPFSTPTTRIPNGSPSIGTASELLNMAPGVADVYVGFFTSPYYSTAAFNDAFNGLTQDTAPLTTTWSSRYEAFTGDPDRNVTRFNPLPNATTAETMPMLVCVPNNAMPPVDGWPIVIFQHGIGQNRSNVLGIAETLANAGFATVAIDLPLHGVDSTTGILPNGTSIFGGYDQGGSLRERTFGIDVLTETGGVPGLMPDGNADSSGVHFFNVQNLSVARDNLQQAIADLVNLRVGLRDLTVMGNDVFDESRIQFVGHSLGGIVGTPFVALQPGGLEAATLGMAGSQLPYLLNGSPIFGPTIEAALGSVGVLPGTPAYVEFLAAAQAIVDAGDPINYAGSISALGPPIYAVEIVGGGTLNGSPSPPDLVVPNSVPGAPLAGTEPLVTAMGLDPITMSTSNAGGIQGVVRINEGDHSSLITPGVMPTAGSLAAFMEIQIQLASFHASSGTAITVMNSGVVEQ